MEKALEILGIIICCVAALYVLAGIILIAAAILGGLADEREKHTLIMSRTSKENRRYYLHRKVKDLGLKIKPVKRTIYIHDADEIKDKYSIELRDNYRYNIQFEIK